MGPPRRFDSAVVDRAVRPLHGGGNVRRHKEVLDLIIGRYSKCGSREDHVSFSYFLNFCNELFRGPGGLALGFGRSLADAAQR